MTNLRFRLERLEEERAARPKLNSEQMRELACRRLPLDPRRIYQPRWMFLAAGPHLPGAHSADVPHEESASGQGAGQRGPLTLCGQFTSPSKRHALLAGCC